MANVGPVQIRRGQLSVSSAPLNALPVSGNIAMLEGATRADTKAMVDELQRAVDATAAKFEKEYGTNPVTFYP